MDMQKRSRKRLLRMFIHRLPPCVAGPLAREPISEQAVFESAKDFPGQEFGVPVHIVEAEESGHLKASTALPSRPAIIIE
jgi:leucyl-tRNA synthetase